MGNQLFQYAAGRRLSILHDTTMKLDLSWFDERSPPYGLSAFDVHEAFATKEEVSELKGASKRGISRITFRIAQKIRPYYRRSVFAEPHLRPYDPNIERTPTNLYLEGYWQSERYFLAIQEIIKLANSQLSANLMMRTSSLLRRSFRPIPLAFTSVGDTIIRISTHLAT